MIKSIYTMDSIITENGYGIYQSKEKTAKTLLKKDNYNTGNNDILDLSNMIRLWMSLNDINSENFLEKIKEMTITSTIGAFPQSFKNGDQLLDIKPSIEDDYLIYIEGTPDVSGIQMRIHFANNTTQRYYETYTTFVEFQNKIIELFHHQNDAPILSELGILSLQNLHNFSLAFVDDHFVLKAE